MTRWLVLSVVAVFGCGCESIAYYGQSVTGHLGLMAARQDIAALIDDTQTSTEHRARLQRVLQMRRFASEHLSLPSNHSYQTYVDVGRPYVVWTVVAAPEFSLTPKTWCFPVVGCLAYRGYFKREQAESYGRQLRAQGLDTFVGGSQAYSTLGWFDDPLLSTMLDQSDAELAAVLFHELAHQQLYVAGDTAFNEAFAVAVERAGVRRWLQSRGEWQALERYEDLLARRQAFTGLLLSGRRELGELYAQELPVDVMRERKAAIIVSIGQRFKESTFGTQSAGEFIADLNNAKLALVATYWELVPAFMHLLERQQGDFARFYAAVETLAEQPFEQRHVRLRALID